MYLAADARSSVYLHDVAVVEAHRLVLEAEKARVLLDAARYLGETLDPLRVYGRFRELLAQAVPHDGVVVSSWDEEAGLIRCEYAWVEGRLLDPETLPALQLNPDGGMQSRVIVSGEPLLENDVEARVKGGGTYYAVDKEGTIRKLPESGPAGTSAAMMVPIRHEGRVVGVVQLMSDHSTYSEDQLELLEGLAAQMAAAVRNARLHEERSRLVAAEAAASAAAAEREHAARVLEAVGDGILVVGEDGTARFWNAAAEMVTGRLRADVLGRPVTDVFTAWATIADGIPVADSGAVARPVTLPADVADRELWLSFVAVRSPEGIVYAFRDFTAERRLDEAKTDFIATVSHELRTPMAAVLGAALTLLRPDIDLAAPHSRALLEAIASQATRLARITEDVLLASRLDRGELPLATERVDVAELVGATVLAFQPRLPESLSVENRVRPELAVMGDRARIQQVLFNLLDNAVKYSAGDGEVAVSAHRSGASVLVSVYDRGIGIPRSEREAIFEKFYRVDPHLLRSPGGTGLGLYVSRELIRRMGGRIGVRERSGGGSTFFFELPAA
jgi:two-component system phosphate regulon sensor histidine kinase PhoR